MRNFSPVSKMRNGQRSWGRVPAQRDKKADMRNTKIITFAPIIAFATLKAESLQLIAMLMMRKMQQANTRRCHLGQNSSCFHPGNRDEESYGKIPRALPEIPVGKKPRSREPSQPALSYEHIEAEVRRDLGNRAHMKRTLKKIDLLLRVFLHVLKGKKIATQCRTRTFRILSSLPYHYTTTPTRQDSENFGYIH